LGSSDAYLARRNPPGAISKKPSEIHIEIRPIASNPELGKISLGRALKGVATGGISEIAKKGKKVAKTVKGAVKSVAGATKLAGGIESLIGGMMCKGGAIPGFEVMLADAAMANMCGKKFGLGVNAKVGIGGSGKVSLPNISGVSSAASSVAAQVTSKLAPEVQQISKLLADMKLKDQATSEHNSIKARKDFQKEVLAHLKRIRVSA
jgi:hypothetical protein